MGLDTVELVLDVEEKFDIEISDVQAASIITVGDFCRVVEENCAKVGRPLDIDAIFQTISSILHKNYLVPSEEIHPHSRIVEDLQLD